MHDVMSRSNVTGTKVRCIVCHKTLHSKIFSERHAMCEVRKILDVGKILDVEMI